jgi:hypothetical protein
MFRPMYVCDAELKNSPGVPNPGCSSVDHDVLIKQLSELAGDRIGLDITEQELALVVNSQSASALNCASNSLHIARDRGLSFKQNIAGNALIAVRDDSSDHIVRGAGSPDLDGAVEATCNFAKSLNRPQNARDSVRRLGEL